MDKIERWGWRTICLGLLGFCIVILFNIQLTYIQLVVMVLGGAVLGVLRGIDEEEIED